MCFRREKRYQDSFTVQPDALHILVPVWGNHLVADIDERPTEGIDGIDLAVVAVQDSEAHPLAGEFVEAIFAVHLLKEDSTVPLV